MVKTHCTKALPGWRCTREGGHDGPCAAVRVPLGPGTTEAIFVCGCRVEVDDDDQREQFACEQHFDERLAEGKPHQVHVKVDALRAEAWPSCTKELVAGWRCTLDVGHDGPCAAIATSAEALDSAARMGVTGLVYHAPQRTLRCQVCEGGDYANARTAHGQEVVVICPTCMAVTALRMILPDIADEPRLGLLRQLSSLGTQAWAYTCATLLRMPRELFLNHEGVGAVHLAAGGELNRMAKAVQHMPDGPRVVL